MCFYYSASVVAKVHKPEGAQKMEQIDYISIHLNGKRYFEIQGFELQA